MLPIRDLNPTRRIPYVTYVLIGINVLVFIYEMMLTSPGLEQLFISWGVVPYLVTNAFSLSVALTFITSMFLHGGVAHIFGNMLYLWIFGDNVEDCMGPVLYAKILLADKRRILGENLCRLLEQYGHQPSDRV